MKTPWIEEGENNIYILSKDFDFLQDTWNAISAYALSVDSTFSAQACPMTTVGNSDYNRRGFKYYADISSLLPAAVRNIYGSATKFMPRNCHGAALTASGITPQLSYLKDTCLEVIFNVSMTKTSLNNLQSGDWIYLKDFPHGTEFAGATGGHSFIYIGDDLCLSMNGYWENCGDYYSPKLKLSRTQDVLNFYGFPKEALITSTEDQKNPWESLIDVYRKISMAL